MSYTNVIRKPLVIAHRGASAFRPEHTLEAYELAIELGANFIEPDLVLTRDKVLIARHENELSETTNIAEIANFTDRKTTKMIDGNAVTGWFAEDFTLAEVKTLRVKERIPHIRPENRQFDGLFQIPTFREIITLVKQKSQQLGCKIGIYPETKHPTFFAKEGRFYTGNKHNKLINICLGELLINTLIAENFTDPDYIFVQSFEFQNLIELKTKIMPRLGVDFPLIQLYGSTILPTENSFQSPYDIIYNAQKNEDILTIYGDLVKTNPRGIFDRLTGYGHLSNLDTLQYISNTYASGIGVWKNSILTPVSRSLIHNAHQAGLLLHCYTLRPEETYLSLKPDGTLQTIREEIEQLINMGVDGFFCDDPAICRQVVDAIPLRERQKAKGNH
ncbi:glycerophosphodiester phosphodiesterase family protein [Crocosphaera sp.]|uniref:glycerophosphodiester phosphodiesterase family protein n=1 Tax=Crocosphaera sp. TaxID=2729996 RepID=UPI003F1ED23E|nr:glycerophosphodiester phosphodiesterase family protein [Crocosphaera sp.]